MAINLLELQPTVLSRDLGGYMTYLYGRGKIGKTSTAVQFPNPLLVAFEKGYKALPGIFAQDITTWAEFKMLVRELKKPAVKDKFRTIIVDTVDIATNLCEKYICSQEGGVDAISQIKWGQGWAKVKRELEEVFRSISMLGYALVFISHDKDKTFIRQDGTEYNQIVPTLSNSYNEIIKDMVDFYFYITNKHTPEGDKRVIITRSFDGTVDCGSRFKYIQPEIDLSYDALVKAVNDAIDKEAATIGEDFIVNERIEKQVEKLDINELKEEFQTLVKTIQEKDYARMEIFWAPEIVKITERYLGKGKKVTNCTQENAEQIVLVIAELKDLIEAELS